MLSIFHDKNRAIFGMCALITWLGVGFELFESPDGIILEASSFPVDEVKLAKPFLR